MSLYNVRNEINLSRNTVSLILDFFTKDNNLEHLADNPDLSCIVLFTRL